MSRSRKLAIYKDKGLKKLYWRIIRSHIKQKVKSIINNPDCDDLPNPKSIVNDYDYSDYTIDNEFGKRSFFNNDLEWTKKMRRK